VLPDLASKGASANHEHNTHAPAWKTSGSAVDAAAVDAAAVDAVAVDAAAVDAVAVGAVAVGAAAVGGHSRSMASVRKQKITQADRRVRVQTNPTAPHHPWCRW